MLRLSGLEFALVFPLLMGCAGLHQLESSPGAKRHMLAASKMENAQQFSVAALEYAHVAKDYPASGYYKTAVFKAAMLSGRQDNPKRNLSKTLYWLKEYLKLPLSEQEQESIQLLITLIEQNKQYQARIAKLRTESQKQRAVISRMNLEIDALEKQGKEQNRKLGELEAEISKAQTALKRIKEIDMRIHQRRLK